MANGILDSFSDPATQGLLALSAGLLQASGPSRMPVPFGAALGGGMMQGLAAANAAQAAQAQQKMLGLHSDLYRQQTANLGAQLQRMQLVNAALASDEGQGGGAPAGAMPSNTTTPGTLVASAAGMSPTTSQAAFGTPEFASSTPTAASAPALDQEAALRAKGLRLIRLGALDEGEKLLDAANKISTETYDLKPLAGPNGIPVMRFVGNKGGLKDAPGLYPAATIPEGFFAGPGGLTGDKNYMNFKMGLATAGAARTMQNVNSYMPFQERLQGDMAGKLVNEFDTMRNLPDQVATLDRAAQAASKAGPFLGSGAEYKLNVAKFLNNNLGTKIAPESVKEAEIFRSAGFRQIMDNLKKMDSQPSEGQQKALQDALGRLETDPSALPEVLQITRDALVSRGKEHNRRVGEAQSKGARFMYDLTVPIPSDNTAPGGASGTPTYNPKTKRLEYPGGNR